MSEELEAKVDQDELEENTAENGVEETMDIWEHINELRSRLLKSLLALLLTTVLSFMFTQQIIEFLARPIGGIENLLSIEMTENMGVFMRVSLLSGLIFAIPFIVYQILAFVIPGLRQSERKWI
ncbi:MAG: twin-arginine translocase subunit TatC, partial [Anaerolineaceae bacterium]